MGGHVGETPGPRPNEFVREGAGRVALTDRGSLRVAPAQHTHSRITR